MTFNVFTFEKKNGGLSFIEAFATYIAHMGFQQYSR